MISHTRNRARQSGPSYTSNNSDKSLVKKALHFAIPFLLGCVVCTTVLLQHEIHVNPLTTSNNLERRISEFRVEQHKSSVVTSNENAKDASIATTTQQQQQQQKHSTSILDGRSILIAIASYDFSQIPHLEEVLDSYRDVCEAGANVTIIIHATVAWPIALIDLLNTRLACVNPSPRAGFRITISVRSPGLRLHLVDLHRKLFYDNIDDYDVFLYTEDDIRVRPSTLASYLHETNRVRELLGEDVQRRASDFNVGIVRYEYDYPSDVVIDDKTRFATTNVSRVYWEHLRQEPIIPKVAKAVPDPLLEKEYLYMDNHHQGMYIATRDLLKAWKDRPKCHFDVASNRPGMKGNPSQHAMGTQRVWMSSAMMYSKRHCAIQQLLPVDRFGSMTVHHLPNKNYRRVGKKGRLGGTGNSTENKFADGSERFEARSRLLMSEMDFHIAVSRHFRMKENNNEQSYDGIIEMVDDVGHEKEFKGTMIRKFAEKRMKAYDAYVKRGGVLAEEDIEDFYANGLIRPYKY